MFSLKFKTDLLKCWTTTCAFAGTALLVLSLTLDMWRSCQRENEKGKLVEFVQGISHECARVNGSMDCYAWQHSLSAEKLIQLRQLIFALAVGATLSGGISLVLLVAKLATRFSIANYNMLITSAEFASVLLGMTLAGLYAVIFIKDNWEPAISYYCLLGGTFCTFLAFTLHSFFNKMTAPNKVKRYTHLPSFHACI